MKKIFVIDWALVLLFGCMFLSGFRVHAAGHFDTHAVWEIWVLSHIFISVLFGLCGVLHIKTHWGWYKSWINKGLGKKSRVTVYLTFIFVIVSVSGLALFFINGVNTHMGLWHYRLGIVMTAIGIGHFIKRYSILRKSIIK